MSDMRLNAHDFYVQDIKVNRIIKSGWVTSI